MTVHFDDGGRSRRENFGDGWVVPPQAFEIVSLYLINQPDQGDWAWDEHCMGLASGILNALRDKGWTLHNDGFDAGENDPCIICGHPRPEHYAWSTECAHNDGLVCES